MNYFLVVYDRERARLVSMRRFGSNERAHALQERFAREDVERGNPNIEVVLLAAQSREALERTHARYFKTAGEIVASGAG